MLYFTLETALPPQKIEACSRKLSDMQPSQQNLASFNRRWEAYSRSESRRSGLTVVLDLDDVPPLVDVSRFHARRLNVNLSNSFNFAFRDKSCSIWDRRRNIHERVDDARDEGSQLHEPPASHSSSTPRNLRPVEWSPAHAYGGYSVWLTHGRGSGFTRQQTGSSWPALRLPYYRRGLRKDQPTRFAARIGTSRTLSTSSSRSAPCRHLDNRHDPANANGSHTRTRPCEPMQRAEMLQDYVICDVGRCRTRAWRQPDALQG
jgi:hypothetical protein